MANKYSVEERAEALKLADEIGTTAAARRLGINVDTFASRALTCPDSLYGWCVALLPHQRYEF